MPQPLTLTDQQLGTFLEELSGPTSVSVKPELTCLMVTALSRWAEADNELGWLLIHVVARDGETLNNSIPQLYHSVISLNTKLDLISAAMRNVFSVELQEEFEGSLKKEIRRRSGDRTPLAHGLWVYSTIFPEGFVLKPPMNFKGTGLIGYTATDFKEIDNRIARLIEQIRDFKRRCGVRPHKSS